MMDETSCSLSLSPRPDVLCNRSLQSQTLGLPSRRLAFVAASLIISPFLRALDSYTGERVYLAGGAACNGRNRRTGRSTESRSGERRHLQEHRYPHRIICPTPAGHASLPSDMSVSLIVIWIEVTSDSPDQPRVHFQGES